MPPRRRRTLAPETVKLNVDEVRESIARAQRKQAALVVLQGSESEIGTHVMLDRAVTIGRDPKTELPLQDEGISRRHCRIAFDKEKAPFFIEDLGSTNGTLLNGKRLQAAKKLEAGDRIYLGACVVKFTYSDALEVGYHAQMDVLVGTDDLTGLIAKRRFDAAFVRAVEEARRMRAAARRHDARSRRAQADQRHARPSRRRAHHRRGRQAHRHGGVGARRGLPLRRRRVRRVFARARQARRRQGRRDHPRARRRHIASRRTASSCARPSASASAPIPRTAPAPSCSCVTPTRRSTAPRRRAAIACAHEPAAPRHRRRLEVAATSYVTWPSEPLEDEASSLAVGAMSALLERDQRVRHHPRRAARGAADAEAARVRRRAAEARRRADAPPAARAWRW